MKLLNEFVIKGSPSTRTAQQKGARVIGKHIIFYEKPEVTAEKDLLKAELMFHAPDKPYEGPICLRLMWLFDKKSMTKAEDKTFMVTRPDVDNLAKGVIDCFSDCGFWDDDNIISKLDLIKGWSKTFPGLFVQIWKMDPEDFNTFVLDWRNRVT
jgi:Holliday junction resolvase RusA-like endonuclease